jgi:hypothetical protein
MAIRIAFLAQFSRLILIGSVLVCPAAPMHAQRGGGVGHASGGHTGGSGHFSRFHFRFGRGSSRVREFVGAAPAARDKTPVLIPGDGVLRPAVVSGSPPRLNSEGAPSLAAVPASGVVKGAATTLVPTLPIKQELPPTFFPSAFFFEPFVANGFFFFFGFNPHPSFFLGEFPFFASSNCFFNLFTEFCFVEPMRPVFLSPFGFSPFIEARGFDPFFSPGEFGSLSSLGFSDNSSVPRATQPGIPAGVPTERIIGGNPSEPVIGNSPSDAGAKASARKENPSNVEEGKPPVRLALKNGTNHDVGDYWLAEGYLEYITRDGARSHIPIDALDVQKTVAENYRRGLVFVLRSPPSDSR